MKHGTIYINGTLYRPEEAQISVLDRGFLYGDSIFESFRVYQSVPFHVEEHLDRLFESAERVALTLPWSRTFLHQAIAQTLKAYQHENGYIRLMVTRGSGDLGLDPALAQHPSLLIYALSLPDFPPTLYTQGRTAFLSDRARSTQGDPQAKTSNYLSSVLATRDARSQGDDEAILLNHHGMVAEGSASNVFAWIDDAWVTPPIEAGILAGITRRTLLNVCAQNGIRAVEAPLLPQQLLHAREVFLSASIREVIPIVRINQQPIGTGAVGEHTKLLHELYRQETMRYVSKHAPFWTQQI